MATPTGMSNRIASIYGAHTQRSPPEATVSYQDDIVTVVFADGLDENERSLANAGAADGVRLLRLELQESMRAEMVAVVEDETGRTVAACLHANHIGPDVAVTTFLLKANGHRRHNGTG